MVWSSWVNAEVYDRFVRERSVYGWLNARLVERARPAGAARILDLACGTGATTLACLPQLDAGAEIVGIDASAEMIGVARQGVEDPRARFEVRSASDVGGLEGTFDRVLCNAAIWQFPAIAPVFRGLAARTAPGARFVFNVPWERIEGSRLVAHPFQMAMLRAIEDELGRPLDALPIRLSRDRIALRAAETGFAIEREERLDYACDQAELMELMEIPAMIEPLTPGLDDRARDRVLRRARERADPEQRVSVAWAFFTLRRDAPGTP